MFFVGLAGIGALVGCGFLGIRLWCDWVRVRVEVDAAEFGKHVDEACRVVSGLDMSEFEREWAS